MKQPSTRKPTGFTLVEMSLVIFLLIALMSTGMFASSAITKWQAGKAASETLRGVYVAQRTYLADYPTTAVSALTRTALLPYLPDRPATFPTITGLDGVARDIRVTVSPPVIIQGSGTYDPSGNSKDSLWDVGE
ncbi:MAG: type II secretion system GspH family protein [Akkermansiaceae bacterium]|jgi:type II secretory pathway pseudopilin PulG|nr:type II secretion system GspH family protein [Akkermansiaceae bacterium]